MSCSGAFCGPSLVAAPLGDQSERASWRPSDSKFTQMRGSAPLAGRNPRSRRSRSGSTRRRPTAGSPWLAAPHVGRPPIASDRSPRRSRPIASSEVQAPSSPPPHRRATARRGDPKGDASGRHSGFLEEGSSSHGRTLPEKTVRLAQTRPRSGRRPRRGRRGQLTGLGRARRARSGAARRGPS